MRTPIRLALTALLLLCAVRPVHADWRIRIATWNLYLLSANKVGLPGPLNVNLLDRYADIISQYDIVVLEEIITAAPPLTVAIAARPQLAAYNCQTVSLPSGRSGRQELYGICYATARLALAAPFDWMAQPAAQAFNGTMQPPQQVWMRPPLVATFTYTPANDPPFSFRLNISHTKPRFSAGARPAGTPPGAPPNSSVFYELWGIGNNLVGGGPAAVAVLGDLNADCQYYAAPWRGTNFTAANGWTWLPGGYGVKTNTAAGSNCAYDRIITNPALSLVTLGQGIHYAGINTFLDGHRVSDHYLVWLEIGKQGLPKPSLGVAVANALGSLIRRVQSAVAGGGSIKVVAAGLAVATGAAALYVMTYDKDAVFEGNRPIALTDVRGGPTPVTIANGSFVTNPTWSAPVSGLYKLVLDVNGDGKYVKTDGDIVNFDDEADFIVSDTAKAHGQVVTVGDNGQLRELFNEDSAHNVYAVARELPASSPVDVWVVSTKLLPPGFPGWAAAKQQGTLSLGAVSVPVNVKNGHLPVPPLPKSDQVQTVTTGPDGTLFTSVWKTPSRLFNMAELPASPPPPGNPVFSGCDPAEENDCDVCENAAGSDDPAVRAACNVWPGFTDRYGTQFNVVVDVNRSGIFDAPDVVDTHDIGDISSWLASHPVLDESANGNPAVGEWKEYLDAKLNLTVPLPAGNTYDPQTRIASQNYFCAPTVVRARLPILTDGSQVGFVLLDQEEYLHRKTLAGGIAQFDDVTLDQVQLADGKSTCLVANDLTLDGVTLPPATATTMQAEQIRITGDVRGSENGTICMLAAQELVLTAGAGALTLAAPNPFSATATWFFAVSAVTDLIDCALSK